MRRATTPRDARRDRGTSPLPNGRRRTRRPARAQASHRLEEPAHRVEAFLRSCASLGHPAELRRHAARPARRSAASPMSSTSRAWLSSPLVVSSSSATSLIASSNGQNVIPSPYGRHRPRAMDALVSMSSRKSRTSRDFPTPAVPSTVNSWHELSTTACSNASCKRRVRGRDRPSARESDCATRSAVDLRVASSSAVSPGCASRASRADVVSGSPVARSWRPLEIPPVNTGPVLTPIRTASWVSSSTVCQPSLNLLGRPRGPKRDRLRGRPGRPKMAVTASPVVVSIVPPWASTALVTSPNARVRNRLSTSGSSASPCSDRNAEMHVHEP